MLRRKKDWPQAAFNAWVSPGDKVDFPLLTYFTDRCIPHYSGPNHLQTVADGSERYHTFFRMEEHGGCSTWVYVGLLPSLRN